MAVSYYLPKDIINAFLDRLVDELDLTKDVNLILSTDPDESPNTPANIWYVVTPAPNWRFDVSNQYGGGQNVFTVNGVIIVSIHIANQQDQGGHATEFYLDDEEGAFILAKPVLKALVGHALLDGAGTRIVNEPLTANDMDVSRFRDSGSVQLSFNVMYDWDLS